MQTFILFLQVRQLGILRRRYTKLALLPLQESWLSGKSVQKVLLLSPSWNVRSGNVAGNGALMEPLQAKFQVKAHFRWFHWLLRVPIFHQKGIAINGQHISGYFERKLNDSQRVCARVSTWLTDDCCTATLQFNRKMRPLGGSFIRKRRVDFFFQTEKFPALNIGRDDENYRLRWQVEI